jgi:hypothetical protein
MSVDNVLTQLRSAASRAGLVEAFGEVSFDPVGVQGLEAGSEGERLDVGFSNSEGPLGVCLTSTTFSYNDNSFCLSFA